jgi:hypothetical protein
MGRKSKKHTACPLDDNTTATAFGDVSGVEAEMLRMAAVNGKVGRCG